MRKRTRERKKAKGTFWKVESRENKKGGDGIYGYTCVVEKNQEKKKKKKKRKEKRMDDRVERKK